MSAWPRYSRHYTRLDYTTLNKTLVTSLDGQEYLFYSLVGASSKATPPSNLKKTSRNLMPSLWAISRVNCKPSAWCWKTCLVRKTSDVCSNPNVYWKTIKKTSTYLNTLRIGDSFCKNAGDLFTSERNMLQSLVNLVWGSVSWNCSLSTSALHLWLDMKKCILDETTYACTHATKGLTNMLYDDYDDMVIMFCVQRFSYSFSLHMTLHIPFSLPGWRRNIAWD